MVSPGMTNGVSSNRLMQLSQFLKVPIIYFFEDYKEFKDIVPGELSNEDLNYSFLSRTFSSLSKYSEIALAKDLLENQCKEYTKLGK